MDRVVVDALARMRENQRFMKGIFAWIGFHSVTVEFEVAEREHGTSSFNLWKLLNFAVDGITSFTTVPLRLWFYIGSIVSFLGLTYGTSIIVNTLFHGNAVPGYPHSWRSSPSWAASNSSASVCWANISAAPIARSSSGRSMLFAG